MRFFAANVLFTKTRKECGTLDAGARAELCARLSVVLTSVQLAVIDRGFYVWCLRVCRRRVSGLSRVRAMESVLESHTVDLRARVRWNVSYRTQKSDT